MSATFEDTEKYLKEAWKLSVQHMKKNVGEGDFDESVFEYAIGKFFDYGFQATTFSEEDEDF